MKIKRHLRLPLDRSFFLFGARNTGKSTLIRDTFKSTPHLFIDLLDIQVEAKLRQQPQYFKAQVLALPTTTRHIVVDEVQKFPEILNTVHSLIETTDKHFVLTGSSARKLMHGHANLLAGRASIRRIFPFTAEELGAHFQLQDALHFGLLPPLTTFDNTERKRDFLRSYAHTYLKEEVWAEHLIRKLDPFHTFLEVAANANGDIVNYHNIARDVGISDKSIAQYFSILEDTLLGFHLTAYRKSFRKRLLQSPKFYFFDPGIVRALTRTIDIPVTPGTYEYGKYFEHFVLLECYKRIQYGYPDYRLSYLRTYNDWECDLLIERPGRPLLLVEVKSTTHVQENTLNTLQKIASHFTEPVECAVLANIEVPVLYDAVMCYPWRSGLEKLLPLHTDATVCGTKQH